MVFHRGRRKQNNELKVIIDNNEINKVACTKFLGVIIDQKLLWHEHINYTQKKIAKGIAIVYKSKRFLSKKSMLQLYRSYINPYLIYCSEVW